MLSSLKIDLAKAIQSKTTCLFLSGGSDSLLLLHVLLELDVVFSVMTMDATFSQEQKKVIDDLAYERNLRVFTYKPKAAYFIGDGNGKLAFVEEYGMLAGETIPFIRDCVGGKKCSYDVTVETRGFIPIGYEINIFGTRRTDRHWSWGKAFAKPEVQLIFGKVIAPLWNWTRRDVAEALKGYGLKKPKADTGNYEFCTACLEGKGPVFCPKEQKEIDSVDWDAKVMLDAFQSKFGVKQSAQVANV